MHIVSLTKLSFQSNSDCYAQQVTFPVRLHLSWSAVVSQSPADDSFRSVGLAAFAARRYIFISAQFVPLHPSWPPVDCAAAPPDGRSTGGCAREKHADGNYRN